MKLFNPRWRWVRRYTGAVFLMVVVLIVCVPEARYAVLGWWRNEKFYDGKPTSLWSREVGDYCDQQNRGRPRVTYLQKMLPWMFGDGSQSVPAIFEGGPDSFPVLVDLFGDPNPKVRRAAIGRLMVFGSRSKDVLPAIIKALNDEDTSVRSTAERILYDLDRELLKAIVRKKALEDPSSATAFEVLRWLAMSAESDDEAFAAIAAMTKNPDQKIRSNAVYWVSICRPDSVGDLWYEWLDSPWQNAQEVAVYWMVATDPDRAAELFLDWLHSDDKEKRRSVFRFMRRPSLGGPPVLTDDADGVGPLSATEVVPTMLDWLREDDVGWRIETIKALGEFGRNAKGAVPALTEILADDKNPAYNDAWAALNRIDRDAALKLLAPKKAGH